MKYTEAGTYKIKYTATDACGNTTTTERNVIVSAITKKTVLYTDGTLIINELSTDRAGNITEHGAVSREYAPAPYTFATQSDIPWYSERYNIGSVKFGSPVNQTDCTRLFNELMVATEIDLTGLTTTGCTSFARTFSNCPNIETIIGLDNLDTSNATIMHMMFWTCSKVNELDCSSFDTSSVTDMGQMFRYCERLETIYASNNFVTSQVNVSSNMFTGDTRLVGAIPYDPNYVDKTYANLNGYFTAKG